MNATSASSQESLTTLDKLMAVGLALFLVLLPFHLVIKKLLPGPIGTYWKEALLLFLVVLWAIRCVRARRLLLTSTALDGAVLFYLAVLILRYLLDGATWVGTWGLYVSILYLPLVWLVPTVLRSRPAWVTTLFALLVGVGAVVALGGLLEFALDTSLWPSAEMLERHGTASMFIYGTQIRRVHFTFDSPTTLANTLAALLPLSLALFMIYRRPLARLATGVAAALMAACIVVTFSRGIWVAVIFALIVMAVVSGLVRRRWKSLLVVGAALALIVVVWATVMILQRGGQNPDYTGVVELPPAEYLAAPVTGISEELLLAEPSLGVERIQTWSLVDPISGQEDVRSVLFQHPPESGRTDIIYTVDVPESGALRFAIAMSPEVWAPWMGDGASFQIYASNPRRLDAQFIFVRYVNPKLSPTDRRWRNFLVDLSPWAGQTINLTFITEAGPAGDWGFDWAGWAGMEVVSVEPDYFASAATESAVLRHTSSITDWVKDETNRDRLAAWSLALDAWRASPLWGQGLGTTGVAALRTAPDRALVTESQVLKSVVELGILGLLALAYLWFQVARVGLRANSAAEDSVSQTLLLGILTSLLVLFIEGLVYQNLEAKQVNAYFWTLVGALGFLASTVMVSGAAEPVPEPTLSPGSEPESTEERE